MIVNRNALLAVATVSTILVGFVSAQQTMKPRIPPVAKPGKVSFASVAPIFKRSCLKCHTGPKGQHGLDVSSYKSIMKGDKEGKVIIPRNPSKSRLVGVLHGKPIMMPPKTKGLPKPDIAKIEAWIKAGAKP
jgi:hypothetical protein